MRRDEKGHTRDVQVDWHVVLHKLFMTWQAWHQAARIGWRVEAEVEA